MEINVNGESRTVSAGATVAQMLQQLELSTRFVAVEVNRQIVPKARHGEHRLAAGDEVEVVSLVGGG